MIKMQKDSQKDWEELACKPLFAMETNDNIASQISNSIFPFKKLSKGISTISTMHTYKYL